MVQSVEKRLFLRNPDGGIVPFDAAGLQTRLIAAFLAAGLKEESSFSEEIVLALEYTLLTLPRPEPVFNCSEVDAAVIRTLESTGFPEVAAAFRATGSEQIIRLNVDVNTLERLFSAHLGCSPERTAQIAQTVTGKLLSIGISEATSHLLMEFARHFERDMTEQDAIAAVTLADSPPETALSKENIYQLLPDDSRKFIDDGILRINEITTLFPSIRFFFFMNKFAAVNHLSKPVTELEVLPLLYHAGNVLESARNIINNALNDSQELPCCLTLPDLSGFMSAYVGETPAPELTDEFAEALSAGLKCKLHNLVIS